MGLVSGTLSSLAGLGTLTLCHLPNLPEPSLHPASVLPLTLHPKARSAKELYLPSISAEWEEKSR
jgi:hypothetical protein